MCTEKFGRNSAGSLIDDWIKMIIIHLLDNWMNKNNWRSVRTRVLKLTVVQTSFTKTSSSVIFKKNESFHLQRMRFVSLFFPIFVFLIFFIPFLVFFFFSFFSFSLIYLYMAMYAYLSILILFYTQKLSLLISEFTDALNPRADLFRFIEISWLLAHINRHSPQTAFPFPDEM